MPIADISTNLPKDKLGEPFLVKCSAFLAELMAKPEERVTVRLRSDELMCRGASFAPMIFLELSSYGVFGEEANKKFGSALNKFLQEETKLDFDRIVVIFKPMNVIDVGKP